MSAHNNKNHPKAVAYFHQQYGLIRQCVIAVAPDGKIGYINPHARCVLGLNGSEALDQPFAEMFLMNPAHPDSCLCRRQGTDIPLKYETDSGNPERIWPGNALHAVPDAQYSGWRIMFADRILKDARAQISGHFTDLLYVLSAILSNAPVQLFIKDAEDGFKYVIANRNFIDYYHLSSEDVLDRDDFTIFSKEVASQLRQNDTLVCAEPGKIFHLMEDVSYQKNRTEVFKSIKVCFEDNRRHKYLLGVCTDITEQKHNELRFQHTSTMLQTLMDSIPASIYVQDAETREFLFANRRTAEVVGLPPGEIIGKTYADVAGKKNAADFTTVLDEALRTNSLANDTFTYDLNKFHQRSEKLFAIPIDNVDSGKKEILAASFEITHEVELEKEVRRRGTYRDFINEMLEMAIHIIFEDPQHIDGARDRACEYILKRFGELFDADQTMVINYDKETLLATPYSVYSKTPVEDIQPATFHADSILWEPLLQHKVLDFHNLDSARGRKALPAWADALEKLGTESLYTCGIFHDKALVGTLSILFPPEKAGRPLGESEMELLQSVGHIIDVLLVYRRAQSELRKSEAQKQLIMQNIPIPTLLFDAGGNPVHVNAAAKTIFGDGPYPQDEPVRQTFVDGAMHKEEIVLSGREYIVRGNPIKVGSTLINVLATYVDVSELKNVQRQLIDAMHAAESANKAKSFFLANMSHELRTPLNAALGYCELLQGGGLTPKESVDYLEGIRFSGDALLRLINNILDLSKVESGQMVFLNRPTDLRNLTHEMAAIFKQSCTKNSIDFRCEIPDDLPCFMLDEARLRQILLNLIGNSCKFTHDGFIRLSITHEAESVDRGTIRIAVTDSGCGIAREQQGNVFKPFVQQNTMAVSHVYKGTGLGLSISKEMTEHMGGRLLLESEVGKGSTFTVVLPGVSYAPRDNAVVSATPRAQDLSESRKAALDVMLVDDVAMNLKVLNAMCRKIGVRTRMASSACAALKEMRLNPPNLVLTDMWMPEMNGPELLAEIRKDDRLKNIPVVIVTADVESKENGQLKEFDDIVIKPISQARLLEVFSSQYRRS